MLIARSRRIRCTGLAGIVAIIALSGCATHSVPQLAPPEAITDLRPGLSVRYYRAFFRHIDEFIAYQTNHQGEVGPPIQQLNYRTGNGNVLTSGGADGIAADIAGLIRFDKAGLYEFVVQSNDGVKVTIGGIQVIEDPTVHSDRFSTIKQLKVTTPGWYPIRVLYFERKTTSTLELYWRRPGEQGGPMAIVPADALAHSASS